MQCRPCDNGQDTHSHIFVSCPFVRGVTDKVMAKFQYYTQIMDLPQEVRRVAKVAKKKKLVAIAYVALWTELMYDVWNHMCLAMYQEKYLNKNKAV